MAVLLTCIFTACGDSDTGAQDEKPSQAHVHSYSEKNIESHYLASPATCTKKAKYYYSCSCGDSLFSNSSTFEYGDALGHSFTHYVSDNNATYEKDGTKTAKCDRCSETKTVVDKGSRLSYIEENFSLALVGNGYAITEYIGDLTNVHVPSTYQEKPIVSIETRAFYDCSKITEVSLPDTVNEIGEEAFGYCTSLKRIDISACKRIKGHAFIGCTSLTEMTIPNGVISIGEKPFAECSSLKKVAIYSGEISAKVFAGNKYIEEIILGENVTDIAQFAFAGCTALKQLTMPKVNDMQAFITYYFGLETYSYTLNGSGTNKIVPERVNTYVYETNGVQHIFGIPADDTNWYYDGDGIEVGGVYYKYTGRPVAVSSWKDYYEVTINRAYQLPSSWKAEFYYMPNLSLQELTITDQLISTKNDVFKGLTCKIDVKQKYPVKSVSLVGNTEVFLDEFSISNYMLRVEHTDGFVEDILFEEKYLQSDINDLKTEGEKTLSFVYDNVVGESTLLLKLHTFENVSMDDVLVLYDNMPKSLVVKGAPEGTTITYENNNQIEDGDYVVQATLVKPYYETKVLTATLSIRKEKYSIKYVFNNDEAVNDNPSEYRYGVATSLNIPSSKSGTFVSWYEDENYSRLFKGITETTYGNLILYGKFSTIFTVSDNTITGLTDIGKKFTEIAIPQQINGTTIKNIANSAFKYCTGLTSITIPDSVTSIGDYAFSGCSKLQDIYITDIAAWCNISGLKYLMDYGSSNKKFYLNDEFVTTLIIPDGVTTIPSYSFSGCSGLTSITIPDSVTSIGSYAFSSCGKLQDIYITDIAAWCNISGLDNLMGGSSSNKNLYVNNGLVTSVTIPAGVIAIPSFAFRNCRSFTSITIPDSVTSIGNDAFSGCSGLTSITIPDSVTSIGSSAFRGCKDLTSATIGNSVTNIGFYAFEACSGLTSVVIGNSVTSIGNSAFSGCSGLTSVTIGNGVTSIGSYAFRDCSGLTSVTIPNSVTSIEASAFYGCSGLITVNWNATSCTSAGSSSYPVFKGCSNLTTVNIGDNVTTIPSYAFYGCSGLTSVTIGNSVTGIGSSAFSGCRGLTNITIPDSVTSIGNDAFSGCYNLQNIYITDIAAWCNISGLDKLMRYGSSTKKLYINNELVTSITIPNGVTAIPSSAFRNCSGLTSITIPDSVTSIGDYAFRNCTGLTSATIGNSVTNIGSYAFEGCSNLQDIYITDIAAWCNISGLNNLMLYSSNNKNLYINNELVTSITIPNSVTSIGNYAFYGCSGLTSITIPNSVTSIGNRAFSSCSGLTSITIPNSVTSIGDSAFYGCYRLIEVYNKSTLSITAGSFSNGYVAYYAKNVYTTEGGSKLTTDENGYVIYTDGDEKILVAYTGTKTELTLPADITQINKYAFCDCSGLTNVTIPNSVTRIGYSAFWGCSSLINITIPNSVTSIGDSAFYNCSGLKSVTIPNSVTSIGSYAFYNCTGLTSITIPDSVTSIGDYAFDNCSGLKSITIPDSVTSIGDSAFSGCSDLTSINFGGTKAQWNAISKGYEWNYNVPSSCKIVCTDGDI